MFFHNYSKQIVESYLGTVAYVDDLIFSNGDEIIETDLRGIDIREVAAKNENLREKKSNDESKKQLLSRNIDPKTFTKGFIEKGIHCALLEITKEEDSLESIKNTLKKSDVVILDWQMHRDSGEKATELLFSVIENSKGLELRLIIIFTNDPSYNRIISDSIIPRLKEIKISEYKIDESGCSILFGHTKIVVLNKENVEKNDSTISDEELPDRVIEEFTEITKGLISNTVLSAVSTVRRNTHYLLGLFNRSLDSAYLSHRAMISTPEDSESLVKETITDVFHTIISNSNITEVCNIEKINNWLDESNYERKKIEFKKKELDITLSDLKIWQKDGYNKFFTEKAKSENIKFEEKDLGDFDRYKLKKCALDCFSQNEYSDNNANEEFAILTHHKSNLLNPSYLPQLTLGVVIQRYHQYYLCIQQRCDSIRLEKLKSRSFLFLQLEESEKNYSIIFKNFEGKYVKLKVKNKNCYDLLTLNFFETFKGSVYANKSWEYYCFIDTHKRSYRWVLDLNDSHAQRIVNEYSANISRVGLDESEWLRRSNNA